ncbi:anthrone oxygenase family protein [Flagellimonas flava]|uniref:Uncharacterized membrane protein n=1 Tax=Flagellimonas flava TaxID=570519 RepID=A0A1M5JTQ0_9FLAO|nr:DUF1772 domain-containing protein [Allomuricauda flava]SHG43992.1 Uncharacterized membrane protein [Allomuricauda flava]
MGNITLFLAIILTGLTAGLCFTWGNAVTPGIGNLSDSVYLQSFQSMNRSILNPTFFVVFFGPVLLSVVAGCINRVESNTALWLCLAAALLYFLGLALVTIFGNVPLNELLDKADLLAMTPEELSVLRQKFEKPWNNYHRVRIISSIMSFGLLVVASILK